MSLWWRQRETRQEFTPRPLSDVLLGWLSRPFTEVDLSRAENSLQSVAVRSAVDLIASIGSELPLDVFRGKGAAREEIPMSRHPWLDDPEGSGQGLPDWCYQALVSWLLRGNLFGDILEKGPGGIYQQVALWHPDVVHPQLEDGLVRWFVQGQEVSDRRMLFRRVNPIPGVVLGLSPIAYHAHTIGLSLTGTRYGLQWFQDGAHPSGILRNTESTIDAEQAKTVKDRFLSALRGTREPVVFGKGWEFSQLQINPEESQFLETQGFTEAQSARIFGPGVAEILGYGGENKTLTYSNVVDRDLHVLKYALNKWLRRLERLLSQFLPAPHYALFNRDALLQTNTVQRYQAHASALQNNWKTVNEVRDREDLAPVPWGNQPTSSSGGTP